MVFDEQWFQLARPIVFAVAEISPITSGLSISKEQVELFLSDEVENPLFSYDISRFANNPVDEPVSAVRSAMVNSDTHAVVIELYDKKLQRQLERQALLQATLAGDDHAFFEQSKTLYGVPSKRYISYVAREVLRLCDDKKATHSLQAKRLRAVLGKITAKPTKISQDILPEPVKGSPRIMSRQQVLDIFTETLTRLELTNWTLMERQDNHSHFVVLPERQQVLVPRQQALLSRTDLTEIKTKALAEHEIGVHVLRSARGKQQPLQLLSIGLHDYLGGEEGLATYVQQQIEGATEFYGFDRYLAAMLAVGSDGVPRDFRGVFTLMRDYYTLVYAAREDGADQANTTAWDVTIRLFRGTTGTTPGCIYTKDILYLENNIELWNLLIDKPHVFDQLFCGKFNPLLTHHITALQTLDILKEW